MPLARDASAEHPSYGLTPPFERQTAPMLAGRWFVIGGSVSFFAVAALLHAAQLSVDPWETASQVMAGCAAITAILWWNCRTRASRAERIGQDVAESLIAFCCVSLLGTIASYPVMALSHGFSDATLAGTDHLMRFNWVTWYEIVATHPALQILGRFSCKCIFISPLILLGYFAWTGRKTQARQFIAAFWLAAVISLAIAPLLPAQGPLAYLWHGVVDYVPSTGFYQANLIPLLRARHVYLIEPGELRGLVSAPSFHTASAVIFIATAWPFRRIRATVTIVNLTMLLATVVEGTHYLTDMVTGATVAIFSVAAVATLTGRLDRNRAADVAPQPWPAEVPVTALL
jgi:membrane-associated phospholipid phosphatase